MTLFPLVGQVFFLLGCIPQENPPANAGDIRDVGLIPGLERSPGGGQKTILRDLSQTNQSSGRKYQQWHLLLE